MSMRRAPPAEEQGTGAQQTDWEHRMMTIAARRLITQAKCFEARRARNTILSVTAEARP
jgi:hypothetical protein